MSFFFSALRSLHLLGRSEFALRQDFGLRPKYLYGKAVPPCGSHIPVQSGGDFSFCFFTNNTRYHRKSVVQLRIFQSKRFRGPRKSASFCGVGNPPKDKNHAPARPAGGRAPDGLPIQGRRPGKTKPVTRKIFTHPNGVQGLVPGLLSPIS